MGLQYQFKKAQKTLNRLAPADRDRLEKICGDIQKAEKRLRVAAEDALVRCGTACRGICCRNIDLDAVLGCPDFVYILTLENHLADRMAACLQNESPLYIADCIFLENGIGPCIFPGTVMPELCITTFCTTESPAPKEIKQLKWKFFQLGWFLGTLKIRISKRYLVGLLREKLHFKQV
jgi:hypothetical protein